MKNDWEIKTLGEVCESILDGDWIESKDQSSKGIRLIQTGNIGESFFKDRVEKARYISESIFARLHCTEIFAGDCLVSRLPEPVGRACLLPELTERSITAVDCSILRFKNLISPSFFVYYSLSTQYLTNVEKNCSGATRKRISRKNLSKIEIPVPPLAEQKRIVGVLDEKFGAIAELQRVTEQQIVDAKELFESRLNEVFKNSKWEQKKFEDFCILQRGYDLPTRLRKEGIHPLLSANGITDYIDQFKVKGPGVTTGRSGSIGFIHYIESDFWPLNTALYIKDFKGNDERFVYYFLKSFDLGRFSSGAGVPTLNRNHVHSEIIRITSDLNKQNQIVNELDKLSEKTKELEAIFRRKIADLEELKKSYLQDAFAGKL